MKRIFYFSSVVFFAVLFNACQYVDIVPEPAGGIEIPEELSFAGDIAPIFQELSCTNCHPGMSQPDLSAGNAYNSLVDGSYVNIDNPSVSKVLIKPKEDSHPSYSAKQAAYILAWIERGAENN